MSSRKDFDIERKASVLAYMMKSEHTSDFNTRSSRVKDANDGEYPAYWYVDVVPKVSAEMSKKWKI